MIRRAAALYGLVATGLCWPALADLRSSALGHPDADTWNHVWGYHHIATALAEGRSPFHVTALAWPDGGALWFVDLLGALATLPVSWILGPVAAYNLAIWANLLLSGVAAFALARRVCGGAAGPLAAGFIFQLCPHVLAQVHNGISETVATGWLPLAMLAALRALDHPLPRRGVALGLALACAALASWYTALFAGAAITILIATAGLHTPARLRAALPALGIAALVGGALIVPAALTFAATLDSADALVGRDPSFVWRTLVGHNMTDLWALGLPIRSPDLQLLFDEALITVVYVSAAVWLPALAAWRRGPGWAAAALACLVLSLGPFLYVGGEYLRLGTSLVPLPFAAVFDLVPALSRVSHAYRLVVPMTLCLGMLVGLGLRWSHPSWAVGLVGAMALDLVVRQPLPLPLPVARLEVPEVHTVPAEGAVIDLPLSFPTLARSRYTAWQIHHGRPIPYALNDPTPATLWENPLGRALITLERSPTHTLPPRLPIIPLEIGRRELRDAGFTTVVLHRSAYPTGGEAPVIALLELLCGPGEHHGDALSFSL